MDKKEEQELVKLLKENPALTKEERLFFQSTFDIMSDEQKERLLYTLKSYYSELDRLEKKYWPEINELNRKHLEIYQLTRKVLAK